MQHEVTIKMLVVSPHSEEHVAELTQAVCKYGTVMEAIAEGLKLGPCPRLLSVEVGPASRRSTSRA